MIQDGFLLTRQWRDTDQGIELIFWMASANGPVKVSVPRQRAVAFIESPQLRVALHGAESGVSTGAVAARSHITVCETLQRQFGTQFAELTLRSFRQQPVTAVYFAQQKSLLQAREWCQNHSVDLIEADIRPPDRYLMERFIRAGMRVHCPASDVDSHSAQVYVQPCDIEPILRSVSLDIETSMDGRDLFSIACSAPGVGVVFMIGTRAPASGDEWSGELRLFNDEANLLRAFLAWFAQFDADLILGWNVVGFDLRFLQRKCDQWRIPFSLGRQRECPEWRETRDEPIRHFVLVPGRVVLDGIDVLKSASYQFDSYALDAVAHSLLKRGKQIDTSVPRGAEISRLFHQDKLALAAYNLEDCRLVEDIFRELHLIEFACERARLTGLPLDKTGGSVAAFENLYLPRLHRHGYVAPNLGWVDSALQAPGGYVMESQPGLYRHVLVLDFKSLYPSIIRTFKIDPLSLIEGMRLCSQVLPDPDLFQSQTNPAQAALLRDGDFLPGYHGAVFSKQAHLLPDIIAQLWLARDQAKRAGNAPLSQAIKIIMNSFYGVLGTPLCRFFDPRLAASITRRAHDILRQTRQLIEARGYPVIYGDTDSVFVWLTGAWDAVSADALGRHLADELTQWWRDTLAQRFGIDSCMELEFETYFKRFHMPTMRGSETGSKKRYAGLACDQKGAERLIFKGLENVRTDWTPLARQLQSDVYQRVFHDQPVDDLIRSVHQRVLAGELDQQLVYRKRIRKPLCTYTRNAPPSVQAARKADVWLQAQGKPERYRRGGWISYVMTLQGPEALECHSARLDYQHYIDRQLAPAVDGVLACLGLSLETLLEQQLSLPLSG